MLSFLLPFASKIVSDAVSKIPDDAELGEKLIDLCSSDLERKQSSSQKLTWMINFLEQVEKSIQVSLIALCINTF